MSEAPLPDFRSLPSVTAILDALTDLPISVPHPVRVEATRTELQAARQRRTEGHEVSTRQIVANVRNRLLHDRRTLRPVINATGIVLHTNLGRSLLAESAAKAAYEAATHPVNLELDLSTGKRSHRSDIVRDGIRHLTGAESGTVVNNCAAATVIVLRALAAGKEVVVSRGQLVEIGGGFRIPEIMAVSGATLREVGTTNITRLTDYEHAIGPQTGLLMRIHTSNFRQQGFVKSVPFDDLVSLGRHHGIPVVDDAGSGLAVDGPFFNDAGEPNVKQSISMGADVVMFSGDKLLGGPQAGIIAGKKASVDRIERDPLMRAFRCDKMTLAALAETLRLYRDPATVLASIPTLRMLAMTVDDLRPRSESMAARLRTVSGMESVSVREDETFAGGGSMPDRVIKTVVVAVKPTTGETEFAARLRSGDPAVMARIHHDHILFDLRTVRPDLDETLTTAIARSAAPRA